MTSKAEPQLCTSLGIKIQRLQYESLEVEEYHKENSLGVRLRDIATKGGRTRRTFHLNVGSLVVDSRETSRSNG